MVALGVLSAATSGDGVAVAAVAAVEDKVTGAAAAAPQAQEVREVRLPAGWEGLSFKLDSAGRLIVSEVPKACFSSAAFGAGAKPQVAGVSEGDEVATINQETPARAVERIMTEGDPWNGCSAAQPPHEVGSKGKFDSPPCATCDFIRRRKGLGLDVALQMWLRAVKRDIQIILGVRTPGAAPDGAKSLLDVEVPAGVDERMPTRSTSTVDLSATSKVTGSIAELKSLDEHRGQEWEAAAAAKGKGKGKKGKGKGKGKGKEKPKRPSGPDLPRTRLCAERCSGEAVEWKGKYGWIKPAKAVDHPLAGKHRGKLYVHSQDLVYAEALTVGATCSFYVFSDVSGIGAEECIVEGEDDWDMAGDDSWGESWSDKDWEMWEKGEWKEEQAAGQQEHTSPAPGPEPARLVQLTPRAPGVPASADITAGAFQ